MAKDAAADAVAEQDTDVEWAGARESALGAVSFTPSRATVVRRNQTGAVSITPFVPSRYDRIKLGL